MLVAMVRGELITANLLSFLRYVAKNTLVQVCEGDRCPPMVHDLGPQNSQGNLSSRTELQGLIEALLS